MDAASRSGLWLLRIFYAVLVVFLYAPIVVLGVFSLNDSTTPSFPLSGFTTRWYAGILSNPQLLHAMRSSLIVGVASSIIAVALGVLTSIALVRRRFKGRAAVSALALSPLVIPYLVFGIALLILFKTLDKLLTDSVGFYIGLGLHAVVVGHVVVALPYTILVIVPRLQRLSISLDEAARDLGAGPYEAFRRVTLPLLMPAMVSALLISFTLSFDEYAIASFLIGHDATWPVYLFAGLRFPPLLPQLMAVSVIVVSVSLAVVVGAEVYRRRAERRLDAATESAVL